MDEPIVDDPNHRFYSGVPDSFWEECEAMIEDIDLAFDEELIDLKKNEEIPEGPASPPAEIPAAVADQERRLSSLSDTVTAAPVGSLGHSILENIKKAPALAPVCPKQYNLEAGFDKVSSEEASDSEAENLPGTSKKKRKKDKHKKKHKKEKKKKHRRHRGRSLSSISSNESFEKPKPVDDPLPKKFQDEFLDRYYAVEPVKKLQHSMFINVTSVPSDEENWDDDKPAKPGPLSKKPPGYKDKHRNESPSKPVKPRIAQIGDDEDNWDDLVGTATEAALEAKIKTRINPVLSKPEDDFDSRRKSRSPSYRRRRSPPQRRRNRSRSRDRSSRNRSRSGSRSNSRIRSRSRNRSRSRHRSISPMSSMLRAKSRTRSPKRRSPSPAHSRNRRNRSPPPYKRKELAPYQRPGPLRSKQKPPSDEEDWDSLVGTAGQINPPPTMPSRSKSPSDASNASFHTIDEESRSPEPSKVKQTRRDSSASDASTASPGKNPTLPQQEISDTSSDESDVVATGFLGTVNPRAMRFDKNIINQKQNEDPMINTVKQVLRDDRQPEEFYIKIFMDEYKELGLYLDDILYRESDGVRAIWVPESIVDDVIRSVHVLEYDVHLSLGRTMRALERSYFWPSMLDTVKDFLKQCPTCLRKDKSKGEKSADVSNQEAPIQPVDTSLQEGRESPKLYLEPPILVDDVNQSSENGQGETSTNLIIDEESPEQLDTVTDDPQPSTSYTETPQSPSFVMENEEIQSPDENPKSPDENPKSPENNLEDDITTQDAICHQLKTSAVLTEPNPEEDPEESPEPVKSETLPEQTENSSEAAKILKRTVSECEQADQLNEAECFLESEIVKEEMMDQEEVEESKVEKVEPVNVEPVEENMAEESTEEPRSIPENIEQPIRNGLSVTLDLKTEKLDIKGSDTEDIPKSPKHSSDGNLPNGKDIANLNGIKIQTPPCDSTKEADDSMEEGEVDDDEEEIPVIPKSPQTESMKELVQDSEETSIQGSAKESKNETVEGDNKGASTVTEGMDTS